MPDATLHLDQRADELDVRVGDVTLARYVFRPEASLTEGPKPYLHPLRTLDGALVSAFRPHDHRWHKGLQMTWSHVSGQDFWGGRVLQRGDRLPPAGQRRSDRAPRFHHV